MDSSQRDDSRIYDEERAREQARLDARKRAQSQDHGWCSTTCRIINAPFFISLVVSGMFSLIAWRYHKLQDAVATDAKLVRLDHEIAFRLHSMKLRIEKKGSDSATVLRSFINGYPEYCGLQEFKGDNTLSLVYEVSTLVTESDKRSAVECFETIRQSQMLNNPVEAKQRADQILISAAHRKQWLLE